MCSNASITEILGINDNNLVILGNKKENIKGIEYTVVNVNIKMYKKWKIKMYNLGSTIHQLSYHQ